MNKESQTEDYNNKAREAYSCVRKVLQVQCSKCLGDNRLTNHRLVSDILDLEKIICG